MMNPVRLRALDTVKRIVFEGLAGHPARVYLFGSCAGGDGGHWSDIDVAIDPLEPLPPGLTGEINDELEESTVPYVVDVVDLRTARQEFRQKVEREGIEWTRSTGSSTSHAKPWRRFWKSSPVQRTTLFALPRFCASPSRRKTVWKAARSVITDKMGAEHLTSGRPKAMVLESQIAGFLTEEQAEAAMGTMNDRTLTVHTYDEEKAEELFSCLPAHAALIESWISAMQSAINRP